MQDTLSAFAMTTSDADAPVVTIAVDVSMWAAAISHQVFLPPFCALMKQHFASTPDRQFALKKAVCMNQPHWMDLAIYQEFLASESGGSGVVQVRELFLVCGPQNDPQLMEEWKAVVAASFKSSQSSNSQLNGPRSVRLVGSLRVQQFAAVCSLRYGSPFKKLWLTLYSQPRLSSKENA